MTVRHAPVVATTCGQTQAPIVVVHLKSVIAIDSEEKLLFVTLISVNSNLIALWFPSTGPKKYVHHGIQKRLLALLSGLSL